MGIPYSKQINAAFDQVTPLVASAYEVLESTKNISLFLLFIQILTAVLLMFILGVLVAIAITVNPDLASERKAVVTPGLKWIAKRVEAASGRGFLIGVAALGVLAVGGWVGVSRVLRIPEDDDENELPSPETDVGNQEGKDVDGLRSGNSTQ